MSDADKPAEVFAMNWPKEVEAGKEPTTTSLCPFCELPVSFWADERVYSHAIPECPPAKAGHERRSPAEVRYMRAVNDANLGKDVADRLRANSIPCSHCKNGLAMRDTEGGTAFTCRHCKGVTYRGD